MARQPSGDIDVGVVRTSSTYSAKMASQTSRLSEIVLCGTLQTNVIEAYFDPGASCRSVMASFIPGAVVPGMRCAVS